MNSKGSPTPQEANPDWRIPSSEIRAVLPSEQTGNLHTEINFHKLRLSFISLEEKGTS